MDKIIGVATGVAVVAPAQTAVPDSQKDNFGDLLIAEGGAAEAIGHRWNKGLALIKEGRLLAGWFVGHQQNLKARDLLTRGIVLRQQAEQAYHTLHQTDG